MLIDKLFEIFLTPITAIIRLFPSVDFTIPLEVFNNVNGIFLCLGYVLPVPLILFIISTKLSCRMSQIAMAVVVRLKSFIPFWGA